MAHDEKFPDWFLWLYEHFHIVLITAVLLVGALFLGGALLVENRLSDLEDRLDYAPPRSYVPPNLDDYRSDDASAAQLTNRRVVYVPVYSHIYYQGGSAYSLEATLSIRNVDMNEPIYIESVEYYDTNGKLRKTLVDRLIELKPLQTIEFLIERRDSTGGSGANFLVRWGSKSNIDKPLIETIMVGTAGTQGISYGRTGIELAGREFEGGESEDE